MTMILGGTNPAVTFPDNTVQNTAVGSPSVVGQIPFSTDGTSYTPTAKIVSGTAVASTSGTSIDFTSIPSWVKRITVLLKGVSTSGTSQLMIQIGSGSILTSGYLGSSTGGGGAIATQNNSNGFLITYINVAATSYSGIATIATLGSNIWVESGTLGGYATGVMNTSGGDVTLSGALDRVRITTVNGTDTFDAGSINILYE